MACGQSLDSLNQQTDLGSGSVNCTIESLGDELCINQEGESFKISEKNRNYVSSAYFNNWDVNAWYNPYRVESDLGPLVDYHGGLWRARIRPHNSFNNYLRVTYPRGKFGWNESGLSFKTSLPPRDQYFLRYRLYFEKDFDWRLGGKLPGLGGGSATAGGYKPKGTGWSSRFMWREDGELELYIYHMDMPFKYGHRFSLGKKILKTQRWYTLIMNVKVNTNNDKNGHVRAWLFDSRGKKIGERMVYNIKWRVDENAPVDKFYFATFFGGNRFVHAPRRTSHARFDTIEIYH